MDDIRNAHRIMIDLICREDVIMYQMRRAACLNQYDLLKKLAIEQHTNHIEYEKQHFLNEKIKSEIDTK